MTKISSRQKISKRADEKPVVKDMGLGVPDKPGDYFEKAPIFRWREDIPEYETQDIEETEAKNLASGDAEKFFYRGLHKKYPDLEPQALKGMLENNAKFYFIFKYHEREEQAIKDLLLPAAEALSQQDARAFFYYQLHHKFPELGRGAIVQLIDTNPDSFFDLGLQKDYPDLEESANSARNIKDPNKVELEKPEWLGNDTDKPLSLRDKNAQKKSRQISKLAEQFLFAQSDIKSLISLSTEEIKLEEREQSIFDILKKTIEKFNLGSQLRVAGGWVRDRAIGKPSKDIDIVVDNMSGKEFANHVLHYAADNNLPIKSIGVIEARPEQSKHLETAVVNILGQDIDFVQSRAERYDPRSRIPKIVAGSAIEDAYRRDFTINSLFYNINTGKIEDFTGLGLEDLKNGIVRTPVPPKELWSQLGIADESQAITPKKTFMDDPLRVLRAVRFATRLGFSLAPELIEAAKDAEVQDAFRKKISRERMEIELRKMLAGKDPVRAAELLKELNLRSEVLRLPETYESWEMDQNNLHHTMNVWEHSLEALRNIQQIIESRDLSEADKFTLNLAALLHDAGKLDPSVRGIKEVEGKITSTFHGHEEVSMRAAEYLLRNLPGIRVEEIKRVQKLIDGARRVNPQHQDASEICNMSRKALGRFVQLMGEDWEMAIDLALADMAAHQKGALRQIDPAYYRSMKEQVKGFGVERAHEMKPLIDGNEVLVLVGRKKGGPWVGKLNKLLLDFQLENPSATKEEAKSFILQTYKEQGMDKMASISKRAADIKNEELNKYIQQLMQKQKEPTITELFDINPAEQMWWQKEDENLKQKIEQTRQKQKELDEKQADIPARPRKYKQVAKEFFDTGRRLFVHVASPSGLRYIDKVPGELSVTTWDQSKQLFYGLDSSGFRVLAIFYGRASHIFPHDVASGVGAAGLRYADLESTCPNWDVPGMDEAFFNPLTVGNKLIALAVMTNKDTTFMKQVKAYVKKLAEQKRVSFIDLNTQSMEHLRNEIQKETEYVPDPIVEKYKELPEMKEYASAIKNISKRATDIKYISGIPNELFSRLKKFPGAFSAYESMETPPVSNAISGIINVYEEDKTSVKVYWSFFTPSMPGINDANYIVEVNMILKKDALISSKTIFKHLGKEATESADKLEKFLTTTDFDKMADDLFVPPKNVIEFPKKISKLAGKHPKYDEWVEDIAKELKENPIVKKDHHAKTKKVELWHGVKDKEALTKLESGKYLLTPNPKSDMQKLWFVPAWNEETRALAVGYANYALVKVEVTFEYTYVKVTRQNGKVSEFTESYKPVEPKWERSYQTQEWFLHDGPMEVDRNQIKFADEMLSGLLDISASDKRISKRADILDYPKKMYKEIRDLVFDFADSLKKDDISAYLNMAEDALKFALINLKEANGAYFANMAPDPEYITIDEMNDISRGLLFATINYSETLTPKRKYDEIEEVEISKKWGSIYIKENFPESTAGRITFGVPFIAYVSPDSNYNGRVQRTYDDYIYFNVDRKTKTISITTLDTNSIEKTKTDIGEYIKDLLNKGFHSYIEGADGHYIQSFRLNVENKKITINYSSQTEFVDNLYRFFWGPFIEYQKFLNFVRWVNKKLEIIEDNILTYIELPQTIRKYNYTTATDGHKQFVASVKVDISDTEQYVKHQWLRNYMNISSRKTIKVVLNTRRDERAAGRHSCDDNYIEINNINKDDREDIKATIKHELAHMVQCFMKFALYEKMEVYYCPKCGYKSKVGPRCPKCNTIMIKQEPGVPGKFDPQEHYLYTSESSGERYHKQHALSDIEFSPRLIDSIENMRKEVLRPWFTPEEDILFDRNQVRTMKNLSEENRKNLFKQRYLNYLQTDQSLKYLKEYDTAKYHKMLRELHNQFQKAIQIKAEMKISKRAIQDPWGLLSIASVESDLIQKYPQLQKYITSAQIEKKYLPWFARELNTNPNDYTATKLQDYIQEFKNHLQLLENRDIYSYSLQSLESAISDIKQYKEEAAQVAEQYFQMLKAKREEYKKITSREKARTMAYEESRKWLDSIQPTTLQSLVRKEISALIKQRETVVQQTTPESTTPEQFARANSDVIFEDNNFLVVLPGTTAASQYFGSGTQWCTSAQENNYFQQYSSSGVYLYYIIDKQNQDKDNTMRKIAWVMIKKEGKPEVQEIFNTLDSSIPQNEVEGYLGKYFNTIISAINSDIARRDNTKYEDLIKSITPEQLEYELAQVNKDEQKIKLLKIIIEKTTNEGTKKVADNILKSIAERWAQGGNRGFFYYGLQETYPELGRPMAEKWVQKGNIYFFYYGLQETYPELGRPMAEYLVKSGDNDFFIYGLQKTYPELAKSIAERWVQEGNRGFFYYGLQETYPEQAKSIAERWAQEGNRDFFYYGLQETYPELAKSIAEKWAQEGNRDFFSYHLQETYPGFWEKYNKTASYKPISKRIITGEDNYISYRCAKKHDSAGIFIVLPKKLAKQFKPLGEHDDSNPHVTVLFIGEVDKDQHDVIENTVKGVLKDLEPFELALDDKVTYFKPSKHSDGCKIAKMKVISKGLQKLHKDLKKALENAGVEIDDHFPDYKPHVTLAYMSPPKEKYDDEVPSGSWVAKSVEIWGCGKNKEISIGGQKISKRAILLYGFWLSPNGELYQVEGCAHERFVREHRELFGTKEHISNAYETAFSNGWIRIALDHPKAISVEVPELNNKYLKLIQSIIDKLPLYKIIEISSFKDKDYVTSKLSDFIMANNFSDLSNTRTASISKRAKGLLSEYGKRRKLDKTPEPKAKTEKGKNKHRFVIQEHTATHPHLDLRLENDEGTLSSWVLPKVRLPKGKEKLLAQKTEDHPIAYSVFSGKIPEGEYGAGVVRIISKSKTYEPVKWTKNTIKFKIPEGKFTLRHMSGKKWLIMRGKDE